MTVLFFHRWVGVRLGGTETHIKRTAEALAKRGHTVEVLTLRGDRLKGLAFVHKAHYLGPAFLESLNSYPMRDPRVYIYTFLFMARSALRLLYLKFFKHKNYDVVSVHFFSEGFLMRLLRPLVKWRYLFSLEGYTHLEAYQAKFADASISNSYTVRRRCYENFAYLPIPVPIGTDLARFSPHGERMSFGGKKVILSICRLAPEKDIDILIQAAGIISKNDGNFLFLIVGGGPQRKALEEQARRAGLQNTVKFEGVVADDRIPVYYRSADVFAVTQFPPDQVLLTILDAMASGTPVIATSPFAELEIVGDAGIIVPPREPLVLAEKILRLSADKQLCQELKEKGLKRAASYTWERHFQKCVEIYETLGAGG